MQHCVHALLDVGMIWSTVGVIWFAVCLCLHLAVLVSKAPRAMQLCVPDNHSV